MFTCNSNSRGKENRGIPGSCWPTHIAESEYYRFSMRLHLRNKVDSVCGRHPMLTPDCHMIYECASDTHMQTRTNRGGVSSYHEFNG